MYTDIEKQMAETISVGHIKLKPLKFEQESSDTIRVTLDLAPLTPPTEEPRESVAITVLLSYPPDIQGRSTLFEVKRAALHRVQKIILQALSDICAQQSKSS